MRTFFEMIILLTVSVILAFIGNMVNPNGIPLFGQWNPDAGALHGGGVCAPNSRQINDLDALDLYLSSGAIFVDARSRDDYSDGHIPRSINLPMQTIHDEIFDFKDTYPVDTKVIVYCSGVDCTDSHDVAKALEDYGYLDIYIYPQGFEKWQKEGRPLESDTDLNMDSDLQSEQDVELVEEPDTGEEF